MSKYCRICRNTTCSNHGKDIILYGDTWECDYISVPTNADRIRAMSDEELAKVLYRMQKDLCRRLTEAIGYTEPFEFDEDASNILNWLQQPAEEEDT